jgi:hypothetical protein
MATTDYPAEVTLVSCDVCLKEVPISEAVVAEATDYVVHFCGLECYQRWKSQRDAPRPQDGESAS